MLSFHQALVLGLLQGVSELFPISSLGHSIILPALLGWSIDQKADAFLCFLVATHFATAAVLFFFYWDDWLRIIRATIRSIWRRSIGGSADAKLGWLLVLGTVPAGLTGLLFQKQIQELFASPAYVSAFLFSNGLLLYLAEFLRAQAQRAVRQNDADQRIAAELSWSQSIKVGAMQVLALLPGFSRTGSTLAGGLLVGMTHEDALRFSFFLATPIIGAAAALKLPRLFLSRSGASIETALIGAICAAIASYVSVKFLTRYFKTRTLAPFSVYCLLAGVASFVILSHSIC
jgi:undecaprenyl-diphosphatase